MHHPTDRIAHTTAFVTIVVEHWLEREIAQWIKWSLGFDLPPSWFVFQSFYRCVHTNLHVIYRYPKICIINQSMKEGRNVLFNDTLDTFYLRLYGVRHMVEDQTNPLPPHGQLFSISSKGSFICIIPQSG